MLASYVNRTGGYRDDRGHRRNRRVLRRHGRYALAAPAALVRPFGITLGESASRSEVRAVNGGFGLAIAGVLVYAAVADGDLRSGILVTVGVALAGMAFGRVASAAVDDRTAFYPNWFYCLVEIIAAAALFAVGG